MDDSAIVDLYLDRSESAISRTSEKYGARLRNVSYGITSSRETSEECENDTYMEAWNRIPPHEPRTYLLPFLIRIIRAVSINRCVSDTRLKRKADIYELTTEMESCIPSSLSVEKELEGKLLAEAISRFLHEQSEEKCTFFMRRYFYLDSAASIARRYGCKDSKVRMTLMRMRSDLKAYLEKEEIV